MRTSVALTLLCVALAVPAFADGDVVEMKNGDRISGTIVKYEGDVLIIDTPYAEKLKLDWKEVATISSEQPHVVRIKPDQFVTGRLVKAPGGIQVESEDLRTARTIPPDEIASIGVPPGAQWTGRVAASIGGTSGNYPHNFTVGGIAEATRRTDDDRLRFGVAGEYGETQTEDEVVNAQGEQIGTVVNPRDITAANVRGWGFYDYNLDEHWSIGGGAKLEHDRIKDLNLRTTVQVAPRYRFVDTKTEHLSVYLGPAYINENYISSATEDRDFVSLALGDEFHWKFPWGFSIDQTLDIYPNLDDTSDVLFSFYLGPRYTIANGLFAGVGFNWDYDTKPADFRDRNDFRYLGNVGWEF
jgi:hypothetical protein